MNIKRTIVFFSFILMILIEGGSVIAQNITLTSPVNGIENLPSNSISLNWNTSYLFSNQGSNYSYYYRILVAEVYDINNLPSDLEYCAGSCGLYLIDYLYSNSQTEYYTYSNVVECVNYAWQVKLIEIETITEDNNTYAVETELGQSLVSTFSIECNNNNSNQRIADASTAYLTFPLNKQYVYQLPNNNNVAFKFETNYSNSNIICNIYGESRNYIVQDYSIDQIKKGINYLNINCSNCQSNTVYTLEVKDSKDNIKSLKFRIGQ